MNFSGQLQAARRQVERRLESFFPGGELAAVMRYSLLSGGKRLRPVLTMKFCQAAGAPMERAVDFGCAVEMLHTYSLIHDDLPCMDDDDLRRGRPANHKVHGPCAAILAGDALQAAAFQTVLEAPGPWLPSPRPAPMAAAALLASAAGAEGMCLGQYRDTLRRPGRSEAELTDINARKTGALIRAACQMGVAAAAGVGEVPGPCMDAAGQYGAHLALAFQIRDDMLDVTGREDALGKPVGSDAALGKPTYVTLLGLAECARRVEAHTRRAAAALKSAPWPGGTDFLEDLAEALTRRSR